MNKKLIILADATSKMLHVERIRKTESFKKKGTGKREIKRLLKGLGAPDYQDAICKEPVFLEWYEKLILL